MPRPSHAAARAADRKLAEAFTALEVELGKILPPAGGGRATVEAAERARGALDASISRLRQALGVV